MRNNPRLAGPRLRPKPKPASSLMNANGESWYVHLPDGRRMRARNLETLRANLRAGRIPLDSRVRRASEENWHPLDRYPELIDLLPNDPNGPISDPELPTTESLTRERSRPKSQELRTLGVRGLVEELLSALDSSLTRAKWTIAGVTCLVLAVGAILLDLFASAPLGLWGSAAQIIVGLFMLVALSVCTYFLTQMTATELSQMRPATPAELRDGLVRQSFKVALAQGALVGVILGTGFLLRSAPDWLQQIDFGEYAAVLDVAQGALASLRLLFEVVCWPLLVLAVLLLGPILVIEEVSIMHGLRDWLTMLRQHLGRVFVYEMLALGLAAVMTLPLLSLVVYTGSSLAADRPLMLVEWITLRLLAGVTLTPLVAYLLVANVFIYLNLRYEFFSARDK